MSLFDRFKRPTKKEKAAAKSFKNALKYGTDIGKMYNDARKNYHEAWEAKEEASKEAMRIIAKEREIKFKNTWLNWNSLYIKEYSDHCKESPIGYCVTMHEFGSKNPDKDKPQNCFYCNKEYK